MSPIGHRMTSLSLLVASLLVLTIDARAQTQQAPLTDAQKEKLRQRDQIEKQIGELLSKGKRDESLPLFEKMIALEKAVLGENNQDAASSLAWLGEIQIARNDFDAATEACASALTMYSKLFGDKHWRTTNARLARADVSLLEKMTPKQREQLIQANDFEREGLALYKNYKNVEAATKDRAALAIRKDLLGDHRRTANSHVRVAEDLRRLEKFRDATEEDEKALAIRWRILDEDHPETASSYESLGRDSRSVRNYVDAEKWDRLALGVWRRIRGDEHSDTLQCAVSLALDLFMQKRYAEAVRLERFILKSRQRQLGTEHEDTKSALSNLGWSYSALATPILDKSPNPFEPEFGDTEKRLRLIGKVFWDADVPDKFEDVKLKLLAEASLLHDCAYDLRGKGKFEPGNRLQRMAFALRRDILGAHRDTVKSGHLLAWGLYRVGEFKSAEFFDRQTLALARKALGAKDDLSMLVLRNLAYDVRDQGRYSAAEELDRESLALTIQIRGGQHPEVASLCNNLGFDLFNQGFYSEAELLFRRSLTINFKAYGEKHFETLTSMSNIAHSLRKSGQESEAQEIFWQIKEILFKIIKENVESTTQKRQRVDYVFVAQNFNNLAVGAIRAKKFELAESALNTFAFPMINVECIVRPNDKLLFAEKATLHQNLAAVQFHLGKAKESVSSMKEALEINYTVFGENHPRSFQSQVALADVSYLIGDFESAEHSLRKIVLAQERFLGSDHPETVDVTVDLARALLCQGQYSASEQLASKAYDGFRKARVRFSSSGLVRSAIQLQTGRPSPMIFLAALAARTGRPQEAWTYLEENLARSLLDELTARTSRPLKSDERSEEETLQGQLTLVENHLATLLGQKEADPHQVNKLRIERNERLLQLGEFQARLEKTYGPAAGQVYPLQTIQARLKPDAALIGWLDIDGHPKAKEPDGEHWGFVVRSKGEPKFVRLRGSGEKGRWGKEDNDLSEKILKLISEPNKEDLNESLFQLYRQRLEVLEPHFQATGDLPAVKHLIVLPSDFMHGVPIEVLTRFKPNSDEPEEKDRFLVSYAPSGTIYAYIQENLNKFGQAGAGGNLLALADPAFTADQFKVGAVTDPALLVMRGRGETPLPGTRGEVEAIAKLFKASGAKVLPLLGVDASVKNMALLASQNKLQEFRYLHLATHGTPDPLGGMNSFLSLTSPDFRLVPYDKLTAGQILRTWKLDADLVTLSACQSALGQYRGGEGYVGFSQALFLAGQKGIGARTVVMSQWSVNDLSTAILMQRFYQNLLGQRNDLQESMGKLAALNDARHYLRNLSRKEAQDSLKALGLDIDTRTGNPVVLTGKRPFEHPFYWAPFILVGDAGSTQTAP